VLGLVLLILGTVIAINRQTSNNYPIEFSRNFVDSCLQAGGTQSGCDCSLTYLKDNYTYEEVKRFDEQALENNNSTPEVLAKGFNDCRSK
jgi:hypothetical protein